MTTGPQKSNVVWVVSAIIGVVGTIIGAAITVTGNINVEKLRQDTELTRIAFIPPTVYIAPPTVILPTAYIEPPTANPPTAYVPTQTLSPCRNVNGEYWRSFDGSFITITQTGCVINGEILDTNSAFDQAVRGNWSSNGYYDVTIERYNKSDGCDTNVFGQLSKLQNGDIHLFINGSDGVCDLPPDFREDYVWVRQ